MKLLSRFIIFCLLLAGLSGQVAAQTATMNYIQSFDVQVLGITDPATLTISTPTATAIQTIQYFDGLGRPVQTVQKGITTEGYDMVKPKTYNSVGLDETNYEPYAASTLPGEYRGDFESAQPAFYSTLFGDGNGKSPTDYEKSPLNRVLRQGAPGDPWQLDQGDHAVVFSYLSNIAGDAKLNAILWKVSGNSCIKSGTVGNYNYASNQLYVTLTTGEDGAETYEFKDKQGQVVLKRSVLDDGIGITLVDTYYVYDDFGLLRFVISPEGSKQITATSFTVSDDLAKKYVYCYTYDERNRLIEKQIPGKDPEYYVYDKTDKVIMYQDGNMRILKNGLYHDWMFTKYDALGRVIITGIMTLPFYSTSRQVLQSNANSASYTKCWEYISYTGAVRPTNNDYYSDQAYPLLTGTTNTILTINYYDNYNVYLSGSTTPVPILASTTYALTTPATNTEYKAELKYVTGKPTVNFVRYNNNMLQSATYYDVFGRVIQSCTQNQGGSAGFDRFTNLYKALTPNILKNEHAHFSFLSSPYPTLNESTDYTYDAAGRLLTYKYAYNSTIRDISYTYTTLGQVKSKQIKDFGSFVLQTVDYAYNIRGWLTKINDPSNVTSTGDLFGMELFYNNVDGSLSNNALFNGNISAMKWQTAQPTGISTPIITGQKAYTFNYDKLNRLLSGKYAEIVGSTWASNYKYSEFIDVSTMIPGTKPYDLNGNILNLYRYGLRTPNTYNTIDELKYWYDGNQLKAVDDVVITNNGGDFIEYGSKYTGTAEYTYDKNGNLTKDVNKGILNITYNYLNLPTSIDKGNGTRIEYSYDAAGTKQSQIEYANGNPIKTTSFYTNFVYENSSLPA